LGVRMAAGKQAFLRYTWYDAGGATTSNAGSAVTGTGAWQTLNFSYSAPATAVNGRLDVVMNTVSAVVGDSLAIDGFMLTKSPSAYTYADGGSAGWSWASTAHGSVSSGPPL